MRKLTAPIHFLVSSQMHGAIIRLASYGKISVAELLRTAVAEYMERNQPALESASSIDESKLCGKCGSRLLEIYAHRKNEEPRCSKGCE